MTFPIALFAAIWFTQVNRGAKMRGVHPSEWVMILFFLAGIGVALIVLEQEPTWTNLLTLMGWIGAVGLVVVTIVTRKKQE